MFELLEPPPPGRTWHDVIKPPDDVVVELNMVDCSSRGVPGWWLLPRLPNGPPDCFRFTLSAGVVLSSCLVFNDSLSLLLLWCLNWNSFSLLALRLSSMTALFLDFLKLSRKERSDEEDSSFRFSELIQLRLFFLIEPLPSWRLLS